MKIALYKYIACENFEYITPMAYGDAGIKSPDYIRISEVVEVNFPPRLDRFSEEKAAIYRQIEKESEASEKTLNDLRNRLARLEGEL